MRTIYRPILLGVIALLSLSRAYTLNSADTAGTGVYVETTCGTIIMTVSNDFMDSTEEYNDYLMDLNEIECGERKMPKVYTDFKQIEDDPIP